MSGEVRLQSDSIFYRLQMNPEDGVHQVVSCTMYDEHQGEIALLEGAFHRNGNANQVHFWYFPMHS